MRLYVPEFSGFPKIHKFRIPDINQKKLVGIPQNKGTNNVQDPHYKITIFMGNPQINLVAIPQSNGKMFFRSPDYQILKMHNPFASGFPLFSLWIPDYSLDHYYHTLTSAFLTIISSVFLILSDGLSLPSDFMFTDPSSVIIPKKTKFMIKDLHRIGLPH